MAQTSRLVITVTSSRNASSVHITSKGGYRGLITNEEEKTLTGLPLFGNANEAAFWTAVLPFVQSNV